MLTDNELATRHNEQLMRAGEKAALKSGQEGPARVGTPSNDYAGGGDGAGLGVRTAAVVLFAQIFGS